MSDLGYGKFFKIEGEISLVVQKEINKIFKQVNKYLFNKSKYNFFNRRISFNFLFI